MYVSQQKQFDPAPEGVHDAVCVDITPKKLHHGKFGSSEMFRIVFEIDAVRDDGKRFIVSKSYTPSLHKKANLFKDLTTWRGRAFTAEELKKFNLDVILGASCQLVVTHNIKDDGEVFANITTIIKAKRKLAPAGTYTRVKDRPDFNPDEYIMDEEPQQPTVPPVARPTPPATSAPQRINVASPGAAQTHTQANFDAVNAELNMDAEDLSNKSDCPF